MYFDYYRRKFDGVPSFLNKYFDIRSIDRLKRVGYFCGMDYASKDIYDFPEYISRFDHSLMVALIVYRLTYDKESSLAGLFHDVATPCFSHVIDYMNKDFEKQESTEEFTERIILEDNLLLDYFRCDDVDVSNVVNFKNCSVVDLDRPKMCADRLDGLIQTGMGWCRCVDCNDIDLIIDSLELYKNEEGVSEIGFSNSDSVKRVVEINQMIDNYCHSKEDNYMMLLLSEITRKAIKCNLFSYDDLFYLDEDKLFNILNNCGINEIEKLLDIFYNISKEDISCSKIPNLKVRTLKPLCCGRR